MASVFAELPKDIFSGNCISDMKQFFVSMISQHCFKVWYFNEKQSKCLAIGSHAVVFIALNIIIKM